MVTRTMHSPAETRRLGEWLGGRLKSGDFVALVGDLGAGKTQLSSGILTGLGVERTGGSPTFTLLWEYNGRLPVYHWDVYRLCSPDDLDDLGYDEYLDGTGVNLVEWADRIERLWPPEVLRIDLVYGTADDERVLTFSSTERFVPLLEELTHADFSA